MPRKKMGRRITPWTVLATGWTLLLLDVVALVVAIAEQNAAATQGLLIGAILVVALTAFVTLLVWLARGTHPKCDGHPEKMPSIRARLRGREIERFVRLCERDAGDPQSGVFIAELQAHYLLPDPLHPLHPKLRKRGNA